MLPSYFPTWAQDVHRVGEPATKFISLREKKTREQTLTIVPTAMFDNNQRISRKWIIGRMLQQPTRLVGKVTNSKILLIIRTKNDCEKWFEQTAKYYSHHSNITSITIDHLKMIKVIKWKKILKTCLIIIGCFGGNSHISLVYEPMWRDNTHGGGIYQ